MMTTNQMVEKIIETVDSNDINTFTFEQGVRTAVRVFAENIIAEATPSTRKEGLDRLLLLTRYVEKIPKARFDYTYWVGKNWKGKEDLSCGTTACFLGWATTIPELRSLGLVLRRGYYGYPGGVALQKVGLIAERDPILVAALVFSLSFNEAEHLFIPSNEEERKATPRKVALKFRAFIREARKTQDVWPR